ncbi:uncharacterized protein [Henckelia pumila]|uniref:uncharacterized protein n=1 Tax=Henckelia pumila TaxID=405737 RepID=UPI003C6E19D7
MATSSSEEVFADGELVEPHEVKDPAEPNPDFITSKSLKEEEEGEKKEDKKKEKGVDVKSSLIISGVVIAVIGAIFAVAKKMREGAA